MPEMFFVDSSNVEAIGYLEEGSELWVQFLNGRTYIYDDVSQGVFDEFLNSGSKGAYLNQAIKPNYRCRDA